MAAFFQQFRVRSRQTCINVGINTMSCWPCYATEGVDYLKKCEYTAKKSTRKEGKEIAGKVAKCSQSTNRGRGKSRTKRLHVLKYVMVWRTTDKNISGRIDTLVVRGSSYTLA